MSKRSSTTKLRKIAPVRARKETDRTKIPDPIDWDDPDQVLAAKWMCKQRTPEGLSFLARHVLGQDYWKIVGNFGRSHDHRNGRWWSYGIQRTCGLVDWGEHRRMAAALARRKNPVLFCSRNANKTWWGCVLLVQTVIEDRNIRWLINMATKDLAQKTLRLLRKFFENKRLVQLFGEFKGSTWADDALEVCGRTKDDRCVTVQATGAWALNVGDRCDVLWTDDPVDFRMAKNPERLKAAIEMVQNLMPLCDPGGFLLDTLTPYEANDYAAYLLGESKTHRRSGGRNREIIHAPCGMTATYDKKGRPVLEGRPVFPRLNKMFLKEQLRNMDVDKFNRQYALMIASPEAEVFHREDLVPAKWENRFQRMCSYILTDTSTADNSDACQAVIALVTIDADATAYVLDMRIGKWPPSKFRDNFIKFIQDWRAEVMIVGVAMERVSLNHTYRAWLEEDMRRHGISIPWIELPRGTQLDTGNQGDTKRSRIRALEARVRARKLRFVEERMARSAHLDGRIVPIYRSEGFASTDGKMLPSGEIVDQFTAWRDRKDYRGIMDIPDCLSALDQVDNENRRLLTPSSIRRSSIDTRPLAPSPMRVRRQALDERRSFWDRAIRR